MGTDYDKNDNKIQIVSSLFCLYFQNKNFNWRNMLCETMRLHNADSEDEVEKFRSYLLGSSQLTEASNKTILYCHVKENENFICSFVAWECAQRYGSPFQHAICFCTIEYSKQTNKHYLCTKRICVFVSHRSI